MFDSKNLEAVHLEITNLCQAACPMCTRNIHSGLKNPLLKECEWSLDDFKTIFLVSLIKQLKKIMFCGNFGDPLLNDNLIDMCAYAADINPKIEIRIHTNGSLRNKDWWSKLARTLPKNHTVIFAIDGLQGTHELYRIGTKFEKIIENAKEFINNGGQAEWAYIRFKHNQDQVEEAKALATALGFKMFVMKDSSRFLMTNKFDVFDKTGKTVYQIQASDYSNLKLIDNNIIEHYREYVDGSDIKCYVQEVKEVYIDAYMHMYPCCWVGSLPYIPKESNDLIGKIREEITGEFYELVESLGGFDLIDARKKSILDIIDSNGYQTVWQKYWHEKKMIVCARSCGTFSKDPIAKPNDQFITRNDLSAQQIL